MLPHHLVCATLKKSQFSVNHKKSTLYLLLFVALKKISISLTFLSPPIPKPINFFFGKVLTDQFCAPAFHPPFKSKTQKLSLLWAPCSLCDHRVEVGGGRGEWGEEEGYWLTKVQTEFDYKNAEQGSRVEGMNQKSHKQRRVIFLLKD